MKNCFKFVAMWLILSCCLFSAQATADYFKDYVEYRYQPELKKITILASQIRGQSSVDYASANSEKLAEQNIFISPSHDDQKTSTYQRVETVGEYKFEFYFTLDHASHRGMGGDMPTSRLAVTVNGKKKIDCSIGYAPGGSELISQIELYPEDDAIFVRAYDDHKGKKIGDVFMRMSDPEIITNAYIRNRTQSGGDGLEIEKPKQ